MYGCIVYASEDQEKQKSELIQVKNIVRTGILYKGRNMEMLLVLILYCYCICRRKTRERAAES